MNRSKILYYIGSIVLALIASFIYDAIKHLPLLSSLKAFSSWFWSDVLKLKLELWVIVISIFVVYLIYMLINANRRKDEFDGFYWTWDYKYNSLDRVLNVVNIIPFCPDCKTRMHYKYSLLDTWEAKCPRCEKYICRMKDQKDIEAIIIDNIQRENFKTL